MAKASILRNIILPALLFSLFGCAVTTARVYNLKTGDVSTASFENNGTGHGKIVLTMANGKSLSGEYSTISDLSYQTTTSHISATNSAGNMAWAVAQGFSFNQPGRQFGSAIVAGDGLVIDVVYAVDPWTSHGYGVGKDNQGGKYKVLF